MFNKNKKKLVPFRLFPEDLLKIQQKIVQDKVTFQKLVEVLLLAYLKDNKEIKKIVAKYADEKSSKRRRNHLNDVEVNDLLKYIEEEESPIRHLEIIKELKKNG